VRLLAAACVEGRAFRTTNELNRTETADMKEGIVKVFADHLEERQAK
jgi:hypothetical protein